MPSSCYNYNELWRYSFNVSFVNAENYIILPLGSFARDDNKNNSCVVYVEQLN